MTASKLRDAEEFRRLYEAGMSYGQIIDYYWEKYGEQIGSGTISNWRYRLGLKRRAVANPDLIPWKVRKEHWISHDLNMLRVEGRRRSGEPIPPGLLVQLEGWKRNLAERDEVVHYSPGRGWQHVPRRHGIDKDLIRVPRYRTRQRGVRE